MRAAGLLGCLLFVAPAAEAREPSLVEALGLGGLEARSAALILSGEQGGDIEISCIALPRGGDTERVRVELVIDVEGAPASEHVDAPLVTELYAYALDAEQAVAGYLAQAFALPAADRRGVKFLGHLELEPGEYSLRVLVVRYELKQMGLRIFPLRVTAEAAPLPPLVAEPPEDRVLVRQSTPEGGAPSLFPLTRDGSFLVPETRAAVDEPPFPGRPDASAAVQRFEKVRRSTLARAYADVLRRLAAHNPAAAGEMMSELESSALDRVGHKYLAESLLAFAKLLADVDGDSIVPLIQLHERLYRHHHRGGRYQLSTHSRQMVVGLGEIYLRKKGSEASRQLVAGALASLGGYLGEIGSIPAAQNAFSQALEYDPRQEAALLGLASIHESYGEYQLAAEVLKRLLRSHPRNDEARLRRALCLRRLGKSREAVRLFRAVVEEAGENWVAAVAHQELARLFVSEGRFSDAVELLNVAIERLPGIQRFRLQLAAVYDRMGRPGDARETLALFDPAAGRDAETPRLLYSREPTGAVERSRRALAAAADLRLEALAAALGRIPGSERAP